MSAMDLRTPGPWRKRTGGRFGPMLVGAGDIIVCDPYLPNPQDEPLIEAAPDLLALAEKVAAHFADTDAPLGIEARALVAKATGASR